MTVDNIRFLSTTLSGVALLPGSSDEFRTLLGPRVNTPIVKASLPYSGIVKNDSGRALIAVLVRYDLLDNSSGRAGHWDRVMGFFMLGKARMSRLLRPREQYVVMPNPALAAWAESSSRTANDGIGGANGNSSGLSSGAVTREHDIAEPDDDLTQEAQQELAHLANWKVTVSLDSVVFADGELVGPDRSNSFGRYTSVLRAEQEIMQELLNLEHEGATKETIECSLTALSAAKQEQPATSLDDGDHYGRAWTMISKSLLRTLAAGGSAALFTEVDNYLKASSFNLHKAQ